MVQKKMGKIYETYINICIFLNNPSPTQIVRSKFGCQFFLEDSPHSICEVRGGSYAQTDLNKWVHLGISKNRGTPKWMVYRENPIKMDDLGVPLFLEPPIWTWLKKYLKTHPGSSFQEVPSLKLTAYTWKLAVGRWSFPIGKAYFRGYISFSECI